MSPPGRPEGEYRSAPHEGSPVRHAGSSSLANGTPSARGLGALLIAEALLSFAPVAILGSAIGWPASLRKPAAEQLAAIAAAPDAVASGYGLYLLYSLLIAPVLILLAARALGGLQRPAAAVVAAFATMSALARGIGILRWLTVMPGLAASHAAADAAGRLQIERLFDALSAYGGGIGEVLGVSLLMAAALGTLCVAARREATMPRWLSSFGVLVALLLAALSLPVLHGPALVPVAAAVSLLSAWMFGAGVWVMRRG